MALQDFPRPADDNGCGIHFGVDTSQAALDFYTPRMLELRLKWCLVPHVDEAALARAAETIGGAGIMPVSRWICHIDQNLIDWTRFVRVFDSLGLPAYIQIFNEPSDAREWRDGLPKPRAFVARWCDHAARVTDAGGYPGLQVLAIDELHAVIAELKERAAQNVIERMWFCPHSYGANHPPDYPFDARNQYDHPGADLSTDSHTVLDFLRFAPVFEQELGFVPPFIVGEGGWQFGDAEDGRYARIGEESHALYHATLFDWFRAGKLSNGENLPDYLFAFCPWVLFGSGPDAWYHASTEGRRETLNAIRSIPPFVRRFAPVVLPTLLSHYGLFGKPAAAQRDLLVRANAYLTHFEIPFGFSLREALRARRVSIFGDRACVSWEDEAALKQAGCGVERLLGDTRAIETILADRIRRNVEFG